MDFQGLKYLVVGAGFFGAVIAERIAAELGERVAVVEKRGHLGGNSYSETDRETGIECHKYGSHIFHTASAKVWNYITQFCTFNTYRHKVLTLFEGKVYQMPINLATINQFYGANLAPSDAKELIRAEAAKERFNNPANLEEKAISLVGRPLYDAFVKGYTVKHWKTDPRSLPAAVIERLPVRFSYKSDYFNDQWQGIPMEGYAALFDRILAHRNIDLHLSTDFFAIRHLIPPDCRIIFSGPVDRFFDYRFGRLGWLTLSFEKEVYPAGDFQGAAVMNYADSSIPYTRIHEFRHYHDERAYPEDRTVVYREYSHLLAAENDPYYPLDTLRDREILACYENECQKARNVVFGGRLGAYKYLDMDKAIASALETFEEKLKIVN